MSEKPSIPTDEELERLFALYLGESIAIVDLCKLVRNRTVQFTRAKTLRRVYERHREIIAHYDDEIGCDECVECTWLREAAEEAEKEVENVSAHSND